MNLKEILEHSYNYADDVDDTELMTEIDNLCKKIAEFEREYLSKAASEDDSNPEYRSDGQTVDAVIALFDLEVGR